MRNIREQYFTHSTGQWLFRMTTDLPGKPDPASEFRVTYGWIITRLMRVNNFNETIMDHPVCEE
jgi:hypothetical protein